MPLMDDDALKATWMVAPAAAFAMGDPMIVRGGAAETGNIRKSADAVGATHTALESGQDSISAASV